LDELCLDLFDDGLILVDGERDGERHRLVA
jgi:hypothetical protein